MMKKITDSRWFYILVSILMAFVLWVYVGKDANPITTSTIRNVQVVYSGLDVLEERGLMISEGASQTVSLNIQARRDVFNRISQGEVTVTIDVSSITEPGEQSVPITTRIISYPRSITSTDAIEGTYLDNYRNIWDLYINNATCDPAELTAKTANDAVNEFTSGQAVFYQNGSWEYGNVVGEGKLSDADVTMIPIYIGVGDEANQGLCTGSENYWCVNKNASAENIQATLDFMYWCVTDETALQAMTGGEGAMPSGGAGMAFAIPFQAAPESSNPFVALDAQMTADGKTPVSWNFTTMPSEEWKNVLGSALAVYAADQTDANWDAVVSAFVDNWAAEYALANG